MQVKIIGIEKVDYNKNDGTHVSGANISYAHTEEIKERGEGFVCARQYVSSRALPDNLTLGLANIEYGCSRDGRAFISSITMV